MSTKYIQYRDSDNQYNNRKNIYHVVEDDIMQNTIIISVT